MMYTCISIYERIILHRTIEVSKMNECKFIHSIKCQYIYLTEYLDIDIFILSVRLPFVQFETSPRTNYSSLPYFQAFLSFLCLSISTLNCIPFTS